MDRLTGRPVEPLDDIPNLSHGEVPGAAISNASSRSDALAAIEAMGDKALHLVSPSTTLQFGHWLGWPSWFKDGTSLPSEAGLPKKITVADDLIINANIVENGGALPILDKLNNHAVLAGGAVTAPTVYNAPDLRSALEVMRRSASVTSPYVTITILESDARFSVRVEATMPHGRLQEFLSLSFLFVYHRLISFFGPAAAECLDFQIAPSVSIDVVNWLNGKSGNFQFGSNGYELHGETCWLDSRNLNADPIFWVFAKERLSAHEREALESGMAERLRLAIRSAIHTEKRVPRLKQMAAVQGVSERTLIRYLAAEGVSFHEIVEQERRYKAAELLGNDAVSLSQIATDLGFTDMSSFGRSFRQWFGKTPGQFRKTE